MRKINLTRQLNSITETLELELVRQSNKEYFDRIETDTEHKIDSYGLQEGLKKTVQVKGAVVEDGIEKQSVSSKVSHKEAKFKLYIEQEFSHFNFEGARLNWNGKVIAVYGEKHVGRNYSSHFILYGTVVG